MNSLVNLKFFAFFYCYYFEQGITQGRRIENKDTMRRHFTSYTDACNLILSLCQETLKRSVEEDESEIEMLRSGRQLFTSE